MAAPVAPQGRPVRSRGPCPRAAGRLSFIPVSFPRTRAPLSGPEGGARLPWSGPADTSELARRLYAQDASPYEMLPQGVAFPRSADECAEFVRWLGAHGGTLVPRGGGTSLAGQCVGPGWVADLSRHMRRIRSIDPAARTARVQPGVVQDDLNDAAAVHGLQFAPDTSTSRQATIGGMIGNNSCGSYSLIHGTTRDHVIELEVVLADGTPAHFGPVARVDLPRKAQAPGLEGRLYRELPALVARHRDAIRSAHPKAGVRRRNSGYALDWLAEHLEDEPFNLAPFLCGSEGTLALITEAVVRLVPRPSRRLLLAVHFASVEEACRAVPRMLEHHPWAVELLDGVLLDATRRHREHARHLGWVRGTPGGILAVEWLGDDPDALEKQAVMLADELASAQVGFAWVRIPEPEIPAVWALRKAGLGLLTGMPGDTKPLPGLEDAAVAPEDLEAYVHAMRALFERHGCSCVYYGHASVGLLHLRPMLNPRRPADVRTWQALMEEGTDLVRAFHGSLSGEHGDGRLRAPFLPRLLGPEVHALHVAVKQLFDPERRFNPGVLIEAGPWNEHWRVSPATPALAPSTHFDWTARAGLRCAAENCNGAGFCRQSAGRGAMCPTYQATGDETHSTRGRANLLRQALNASDGTAWAADAALAAALDTCLACKSCATECPSGVDLARLKAEWLGRRHGHRRLRDWITGHYAAAGALARLIPRGLLRFADRPWMKHLLGFAVARPLPPFAPVPFSRWWHRYRPSGSPGPGGPAGEVALWIDEFIEYGEPEVAQAAVRVLAAAGFQVRVVGPLESGRTQLSKGFLGAARRRIERVVQALDPLVRAGVPVVGLEPPSLLTCRDEAPDLVRPAAREAARRVAAGVYLFEEFVAAHAAPFARLPWRAVAAAPATVLLHGHCHQRALAGMGTAQAALAVVPGWRIELLPPTCCGLAGAFGYEAEHYALSMQVGEQSLFPAIRSRPDALICASGASCRQQILHGTGRRARHAAQWMAERLDGPR